MGPVRGSPILSMPKIELHAHLSGSISRECLHQIWLRKYVYPLQNEAAAVILRDPLLAIPSSKSTLSLSTFFPLFSSYIYKLINDASSITYSTNSVLQAFQDDGVVYLELRTTPRAIPSTSITQESYVQLVLSCIKAFNTASPTMKTNLLLSIDRSNTPSQAESLVSLALKYRSLGYPVVGIDLCGDPSKGDVRAFRTAFELARANHLPSTIHFGEIFPPAMEDELPILLSYGPSRLGHVIHVPEAIRELITQRGLGIELCLSSNVLTGMLSGAGSSTSSPSAPSYGDHHFAYWRDKGNPIALSTDDVGIFGSALSNEYALVREHFSLNEGEVRRLARGTIDCIFGGEEAKERLRGLMWV